LRFQMNDEELIQKAVEKDHLTFRLQVDQYQDLALDTSCNLIGNGQVAEEIYQEVLFQVYKISEILQNSIL
jgi:DNA-directed RNA polymerase specialized sigma24 family protein